MRTLTRMLIVGAGSALCAAPALAQGRPLPPQPPPPRSQQATSRATPPAPPPSPVVTPAYGSGYGPNYNYGYGQALDPSVPVTVASDGRVYANFGYGYQLVPDQCSAQRASRYAGPAQPAGPVQPQVIQPAVPTTSPPPAPVIVTPGAPGPGAEGACWTRTRDGRLVIGR
ncbi:MAG: hypothetical protein KGO03_01120 [Gemmatimonadota bacterium]|nr:hypothetical protein [Gemmatimonadota bacterium]